MLGVFSLRLILWSALFETPLERCCDHNDSGAFQQKSSHGLPSSSDASRYWWSQWLPDVSIVLWYGIERRRVDPYVDLIGRDTLDHGFKFQMSWPFSVPRHPVHPMIEGGEQ